MENTMINILQKSTAGGSGPGLLQSPGVSQGSGTVDHPDVCQYNKELIVIPEPAHQERGQGQHKEDPLHEVGHPHRPVPAPSFCKTLR